MADRRFPPLWLRRLADTNTLRVFGAFIAVVAVVVLAGLAWLWVFGGLALCRTRAHPLTPPWSVEGQGGAAGGEAGRSPTRTRANSSKKFDTRRSSPALIQTQTAQRSTAPMPAAANAAAYARRPMPGSDNRSEDAPKTPRARRGSLPPRAGCRCPRPSTTARSNELMALGNGQSRRAENEVDTQRLEVGAGPVGQLQVVSVRRVEEHLHNRCQFGRLLGMRRILRVCNSDKPAASALRLSPRLAASRRPSSALIAPVRWPALIATPRPR